MLSTAATKAVRIFQGDGDYELVKDITFDEYLRKRIAKVHVHCIDWESGEDITSIWENDCSNFVDCVLSFGYSTSEDNKIVSYDMKCTLRCTHGHLEFTNMNQLFMFCRHFAVWSWIASWEEMCGPPHRRGRYQTNYIIASLCWFCPTITNSYFALFRVLLSVIYQRTRCFLGKCNESRSTVLLACCNSSYSYWNGAGGIETRWCT